MYKRGSRTGATSGAGAEFVGAVGAGGTAGSESTSGLASNASPRGATSSGEVTSRDTARPCESTTVSVPDEPVTTRSTSPPTHPQGWSGDAVDSSNDCTALRQTSGCSATCLPARAGVHAATGAARADDPRPLTRKQARKYGVMRFKRSGSDASCPLDGKPFEKNCEAHKIDDDTFDVSRGTNNSSGRSQRAWALYVAQMTSQERSNSKSDDSSPESLHGDCRGRFGNAWIRVHS
jgi:hypothetical protein